MFSYDTGILKREDRLKQAFERVVELDDEFKELAAPHTHELVRLKETEAMLLAARFILGASLYRTESRLSHFREDHEARDDKDWLVWVDFSRDRQRPGLHQDAGADAALPGDAVEAAQPAAPRAPSGGGGSDAVSARQDDEVGVRAGFAADAVVGDDQRGAG